MQYRCSHRIFFSPYLCNLSSFPLVAFCLNPETLFLSLSLCSMSEFFHDLGFFRVRKRKERESFSLFQIIFVRRKQIRSHMENSLPDWNFEENFHMSTQKKSIRPEDELVELLWRDGQVVLQSQTQREPIQQPHRQDHRETLIRADDSSRTHAFLEDQETVSWIQYPPDDPFESEFSSHFFSAMPQLGSAEVAREESREHETGTLDPCSMPPPKFRFSDTKDAKFGDFGKESSGMTVGPSHCGSNQFQNDLDITTATATATKSTGLSVGSLKGNAGKDVSTSDRTKNEDTLEPNATSSSGGSSGCSFGRNVKETASGIISDRKRKRIMETEESVSQTNATRNRSSQRSGYTRKSRAAEVHNLSERRRRDRINERMKALQELIPHCSKTDKASILDEAIDYLKSLQFQLQVMWMGNGMAASPMMFQGVQPPYLARMGMQMPASFQNPMHLSRWSTAQNPGLLCQNPVQYQNQAQNPVFSEQLARYMAGFPQMQAATQNMNMNMLRFGSQMGQQSQVSAPATTDNLPSNP